jgi:hypothetical protein
MSGERLDLARIFQLQNTPQLTVLHSGSRVDFQFSGINRSTQSWIISPRVFSISVTLGVVDVFGGKITAKSVLGDFEFRRGVAVSEETECLKGQKVNRVLPCIRLSTYHADVENGLQGHLLECTDIDSLGIVTEPDSRG